MRLRARDESLIDERLEAEHPGADLGGLAALRRGGDVREVRLLEPLTLRPEGRAGVSANHHADFEVLLRNEGEEGIGRGVLVVEVRVDAVGLLEERVEEA